MRFSNRFALSFPEPKKPTYNIRELAEKWKCPISDFFYYAEEGILQICKQQNSPIGSLFDSDAEIEAASKFCKDPIPIDHQEARQLEKKYSSYPEDNEPISLVITYKEKKRFEEKYKTGSIVDSDQDEPDSTTTIQTQVKFPGEPGEKARYSWAGIADFFNKSADHVRKHWSKEPGFPINRSAEDKVYAFPTQLQLWFSNRQKKPRTIPKNPFTKQD